MEEPEPLAEKRIRMRWLALRPYIVIIPLFLIALVLFFNWYVPSSLKADRTETVTVGDEIVKALDSYFGDHSKYPNSLEALVPKYLDKVKPPTWGEDGWQYQLNGPNGKSFGLKVGYKGRDNSYYPVIYYSPLGWIFDN
ncbi:MAG: hypothetical protein KAS75_05850 [Planctomycetes bacterium]|nr:hypothetical protein [Planctomycetota bacterium]